MTHEDYQKRHQREAVMLMGLEQVRDLADLSICKIRREGPSDGTFATIYDMRELIEALLRLQK